MDRTEIATTTARITNAKTLYDVLGLTRSLTESITRTKLEVGKRKALIAFHPNNGLDIVQTDKVKEERELVTFAFKILSAAKLRRRYDALLDRDFGRNNLQIIGHSSDALAELKRKIQNTLAPDEVSITTRRRYPTEAPPKPENKLDIKGMMMAGWMYEQSIKGDPRLLY
jgi:hypothetical protein